MMKQTSLRWFGVAVAATLFVSSCKYETSPVTGWDYNNPDNGGYQRVPYEEQETGPGLILVEGGTFTMGRIEQDVVHDWNNVPRRVTVSSFYLDETEVTNFNWCEYLYWLKRVYTEFGQIYINALPDTLVWREKLAYNEPYVEYYLRHPAYRDYPVVGVSWLQANEFCAWRTDRVNEYILIREGVLNWDATQPNDPFTTDEYLSQPGGVAHSNGVENLLVDLNKQQNPGPGKKGKKALGRRHVRMEDGILLPRYRLPTEAEWEYAAYGLIGNSIEERVVERRLYPWNGHWVRNPEAKWQGEMLANFVRGRGDYMGVAGKLNDAADITAPVTSYWPNDYGLYNMGGNVSEWVMDVYRPLTSEDADEFRPFRGSVFKTKVLNSEGIVDNKHEETIYDIDAMRIYLDSFRVARRNADRLTMEEDSLMGFLIDIVDSAITVKNSFRASYKYKHNPVRENEQMIQASIIIREIFDAALVDFETNLQDSDPKYENYQIEIIPVIRVKMADFVINTPGNIKWREVTEEENLDRRNYRKSDNIDYLDGDIASSQLYNNSKEIENINTDKRWQENIMYQNRFEGVNRHDNSSTPTTLVSNRTRVYKGGSWRDRAYWMNPGTRRYLDERRATATIGFRCAMDRLGSPIGLGGKKKKKKKK
ncbi:MAG: SUMF1/EgtB/PvdO family nonheme iron enzyme [Flavobacteriales bacterium]|nr:SUMF1/EgtB/PvdO family nonheme iron enzyme [Flavobacteriales bacterium]